MNKLLYVFDLDGVVTNPHDSLVNTQVLQKISLLRERSLVALNTGRSFDWVEKTILPYINGHDMSHMIVVCEKGGEAIMKKNNQMIILKSEYALNEQAIQKVKSFFDTSKIFTTMVWDSTKKTMATIEKKPTAPLDLFHKQQSELVLQLETLFLDTTVRIDPTVIAIDIEMAQAGKYAGAQIITNWIKHNKYIVDSCICFGDSISDYEMARCFADNELKTSFVYLGTNQEALANDPRISVIASDDSFDTGTLAYLDTIAL